MGHLRASNLTENMTEEIAEKFYGGEAQAREAFEELCAMVHNLHAERDLARDNGKAKLTILRERNARLRERNARLRMKYAVMVDAYNNLAEEAKDRSDSSSSSSDEAMMIAVSCNFLI